MTEEFTAVYRMHSLIARRVFLPPAQDGGEIARLRFHGGRRRRRSRSLRRGAVRRRALLARHQQSRCAGVAQLPQRDLRKLHKKDASLPRLIAATDVLRDRERGVPRYCAFRRHLGMSVPKTFAELTSNPDWQRSLPPIYERSSRSTSWSACIAETAPPGFGFSDTAFRIFILMASRRLKSDRFFTADFTPKVYTPAGIRLGRGQQYARGAGRHVPRLRRILANVRNVLLPVGQVGGRHGAIAPHSRN